MTTRLDQLVAEILALPESDREALLRALLLTGKSEVREAAVAYLNTELQGSSRMKSILVKLPDDLATQAQAAGLLRDKPLEALIRRALREQGIGSRVPADDTSEPTVRLPIYRGTSGLVAGIDPSSNRSMLDAADDDA